MKRLQDKLRLGSRDSEGRSSFRNKKDKILRKEGYTLLYLGQDMVTGGLEHTLKVVADVKKNPDFQKPMLLICPGTELRVLNEGVEYLTCPLTQVLSCLQHTSQGFSDCFGILFGSGPFFRQCHVFQAKSSREASDIIQALQKAVKVAIKAQRRKTEIPQNADIVLSQDNEREGAANSRLFDRRRSDVGVGAIRHDDTFNSRSLSEQSSISSGAITAMIRASPIPKVWKRRKEGRDMGRSEKKSHVKSAYEVILESNSQLAKACSNDHPQSPFEHALYAINTSNNNRLIGLFNQGSLRPGECDHHGNTLIHYAVALKKIEAILILAGITSADHSNNHKLRPIHRAVVGGDRQLLSILLERGVKVTTADEHGNTPLHYAACKKEHHESCWLLLQYGAMITKCNKNNLQPRDLLPDLKEMQNRLIISMCKAFADPQDKPTSPLPSSAANVSTDGGMGLLERVKGQARTLRRSRKNKFRKYSRSISNLSELLEAEEDEMNRQTRLQKLQFPLTSDVSRDYFELQGQKNEVESRLNDLINHVHGLSAKRHHSLKRSSSDPELSSALGDEIILEDFEDGVINTPLESFHELLKRFQKEIPPPRPYPRDTPPIHRDTPPINRDTPPIYRNTPPIHRDTPPIHRDTPPIHRDTPPIHRDAPPIHSSLTAAFDTLQLDLDQQTATPPTLQRDVLKISPVDSKPPEPIPDRSPQLKSKDETFALMDTFISQITSAASELDAPFSFTQSQPSPSVVESTYNNTISSNDDSKRKALSSPHLMVRKKSLPMMIVRPDIIESTETSQYHNLLRDLHRGHQRNNSIGSTLSLGSSSSLSSVLYQSQHGSMSSFPLDLDAKEPLVQSLKTLVLLSQNPECISNLISRICIPDFKEKLITYGRSEESSTALITNIAQFIHNLFEAGGSDGKKSAVESGMMDIVVKLLSSRDPIPGTCLMLLNSLTVDDSNDYLRTLAKLPCDPLLAFLEPSENESDSGVGSQNINSRSSTITSDHIPLSIPTDDSRSRPSSRDHAYSDTSSGTSAATPTLQGQLVTRQEARGIVLRLIAISSSHSKMKKELSTVRTISLLSDYLTDISQETLTNAVITLANIAQTITSHHMLLQSGVVERLKGLLNYGPRPRYHAIRALVYLGHLKLSQANLFQPAQTYDTDSIIEITDSKGHTYVRGITIEAMVDLLASKSHALWGGIKLVNGSHHLTYEKVLEFMFTVYRSFVHPIILMRLLLHRLDTPLTSPNPFDWSQDLGSIHQVSVKSIPSVHSTVLHIITQWVELYPGDFRYHPMLQDYISDIIHRLKKSGESYRLNTPHHRLKSLLQDLQRPPKRPTPNASSAPATDKRRPHHEQLYTQCIQLISEDLLPVTLETAITLAGLQLHIEALARPNLKESFMEGMKGKKESRLYLTRLKNSLPAWCFRMKSIAKKVREKLIEFENMTDRNAKHFYIERCQSTPGYNCTFYTVKVPTHGKFRRGTTTQLLGLSDKQIVFLDEKTRELEAKHFMDEIAKVNHLPTDFCTLLIQLNNGNLIQFEAEKENIARQIEIYLDNSGQKVLQDIHKEDLDLWINNCRQSSTSLQTSDQHDESLSHHSSPEKTELEETIVPVAKESVPTNTPTTIVANGTPSGPITPMTEMTRSHEHSFVYPDGTQPTREQPLFCDCPPDPEISLSVDVQRLCLHEILQHPIEVARQVTLIDHEHLCSISKEEVMQRAGLYPRTPVESKPPSLVSQSTSSVGSIGLEDTNKIEKLAFRFNQLGNWVVHSILQYSQEEDRGWIIQQFIITAQYCLQFRNYCSTMAIIMTGLCSPPIRRLKRTWEHVPSYYKEELKKMEELLDSRSNYKNYRDMLDKTVTPAVPYFGIFTRDLTFIYDGNPDYIRNCINMHKRRQLYAKLEEIRHFQNDHYNFQPVPGLQTVLKNHVLSSEEELHSLSHSLESAQSHGEGRQRSNSVSSLTNIGILKHSVKSPGAVSNGGSASNLLHV